MKTLRLGAAIFSLALTILCSSAQAATRAYLMGGLGCPWLSSGVAQIAAKLERRGMHVEVGCYFDASRFTADALAHPHDRIIASGHSMGARAAGEMGTALRARGISVRVIGIDPLYTGAAVGRGVDAVNFYGQGFGMGGARNVVVPSSYGHIGYASDPNVQSRVVAAAIGATDNAPHHAAHHHRAKTHHHYRHAA